MKVKKPPTTKINIITVEKTSIFRNISWTNIPLQVNSEEFTSAL